MKKKYVLFWQVATTFGSAENMEGLMALPDGMAPQPLQPLPAMGGMGALPMAVGLMGAGGAEVSTKGKGKGKGPGKSRIAKKDVLIGSK